MYHASPSYLNTALRRLAKYGKEHSIVSVALPKIGTGLGKLDWETEVKPLFIRHLAEGATRFCV